MSLAGRISSIQQPSQLSSSPLSGQKRPRNEISDLDETKETKQSPTEMQASSTVSQSIPQLQIIPSDIPTSTHNLEIKNLVKYHYVSKHFRASYMGNFNYISTPTFYDSRDKGKHKILMKLFQIVWNNDTEKSFAALFSPDLDASQLASICSLFQQQTMMTMASLEVALLPNHDTEEKKKKAIANIMSSTKKKPYVIGVANRFSSLDSEKKIPKSSSQSNSPFKRFLGWVGGNK